MGGVYLAGSQGRAHVVLLGNDYPSIRTGDGVLVEDVALVAVGMGLGFFVFMGGVLLLLAGA